MDSTRFVICDIEATGLNEDNEIIEVALITWENNKIVDVYHTLVNPLRALSEFIKDFTSISSREISEAPKFYDVADAIRIRLEGAVFVSHNTDFDYLLLKRKYEELGQELKLKTFCTLKMAQEQIPGLSNYNLDALCSFFGIKNRERHRAYGDAFATLDLFQELQKLRLKVYPRPLYLPHHEKELKQVTTKAGLIHFKDAGGKVIRLEPAFNMEARARELLQVKQENRELLLHTVSLKAEATGSELIAEFRKMLFYPFRPHWMITVEANREGEKFFKVRPFHKGRGELFFEELGEAKSKLKSLVRKVSGQKFAYREGPKTKEEIVRHNQQVENLIKESRFPSPNILIVGEGREMGERSLILIRANHVLGYGYTRAGEDEIQERPEDFITRRFSRNAGADLLARHYLRIHKNLRKKTDSWRALSQSREL